MKFTTRACAGRMLAVFPVGLIALGCVDLTIRDTRSLFVPHLQKAEVWGFVAGFGATFAAVPDMVAMFKRRSSAGMNPRMATSAF
jgi:MtN3 and saliva related transmembrane protein